MRNRIIAIVSGLMLTLGMFVVVVPASVAGEVRPNGQICENVKTPLHRGFAVWMLQSPDNSTYGVWIEPTTFCTNEMKPKWWIEKLAVDPNKTCISQWGYKYRGGANGRVWNWTGGANTFLNLKCNYSSAPGYQ